MLSKSICLRCGIALLLATGPQVPAVAQNIVGMCVSNCNIPTGDTAPQVSAEEQRRQAIAQDEREATDDALDRGVAAFRAGDFSTAVRKFQESLRYDPDNPIAKQNLASAQLRLTEINRVAARQANAAGSGQLGQIYDGRGTATDVGGIRVSSAGVSAGAGSADPVVPANRMTPAIAAYETQRATQRNRVAAIDTQIATLNPATQATEVARLKQEKSTAESQVTFLNFSITEALRAPPPAQTR